MKKESPTRTSTTKATPYKRIAMGSDMDAQEPIHDNSRAIAAKIKKGQPMKNAASLGPDYSVDKRREARREHTNHFTNRAPAKSE